MNQKADKKSPTDMDSKKKSSFVYILCGACLTVVVVLLVVVVNLARRPVETIVVQETTTFRDVLVNSENVSEVESELAETGPDDSYTASMTVDWNFADGSAASSNAYVENPSENSRVVYFDLLLASTSETLFSSPYIPVGETLKSDSIVLSRDLDAGDYPAIVVYHLVDDDFKETSTVSVAVDLHILN